MPANLRDRAHNFGRYARGLTAHDHVAEALEKFADELDAKADELEASRSDDGPSAP